MREDVLRAIWASLANRMPVAVGLFDVLVTLHREVPAPLSATVDHVAASPNLMIMVHIIQRLDVSPVTRIFQGVLGLSGLAEMWSCSETCPLICGSTKDIRKIRTGRITFPKSSRR
jgi:hypothetical protein